MGQPEYEEAFSVHRDGIQDFGSERSFSPIGALTEFCTRNEDGTLALAERDTDGQGLNTISSDEAAHVLADRLGLNLEKLRNDEVQKDFFEPPYNPDTFCDASAATIREHAADLAILKYGWRRDYDRLASALERRGVIQRDELDRLVDRESASYRRHSPEPSGVAGAGKISATPFVLCDPAAIEPRRWLYGRHLIRGFLSVTVAPGGYGKSSLALAEAVAMCAGKNLLGDAPAGQARVWYWNLEDPIDEIVRRTTGACMHYQITAEHLGGRLHINSGRDTPIVIARAERNGFRLCDQTYAALHDTIRENQIDVVIIDPFVAAHGVPENDNTMINAVCRQLARLAEETACAVELVHHTRKPSAGQGEHTADDARGAGAIIAAARSVRVLNGMSKDEAARAGVKNPRQYFRVDNGKANLAPPAEGSTWRQIVSVYLGNDRGPVRGDSVGVVTAWTWPDPAAEITSDDVRAIQEAIGAGDWRESVQATDWAGKAVAAVLHLDLSEASGKAKAKAVLKALIGDGYLRVANGQDANRKNRQFVVVGKEVVQW
jgi:hypothetical protein